MNSSHGTDETEDLRSRLAALALENGRLAEQLRALQAKHDECSEQFALVEHQNACLASRYVACDRLHGTLDRDQVLATIREILLNLIGVEELGVFELSDDGDVLCLIDSLGIEAARFQRIPLGRGPIGEAAQAGALFVGQGASALEQPLACIPLMVDGRLTGAIAVFRLFRHKRALEDVDHELFQVLATHAATALYFTRQSPAP
jgi:hypothetical protein